jgi:putative oxidoreductase
MKALLSKLVTSRPVSTDAGLLVLRVVAGLSMLIGSGWAKITAGPEMWTKVGGAMANLGITFWPTFWGFCAALSESVCAALLVLGLLTRPASALLAFTMLVALVMHMSLPPDNPAAGFANARPAFLYLTIFVTLLLTGPGRHALGELVKSRAS